MTKHQSLSRKAAARKAARKAAARKANAFSAPSKCASTSPKNFWQEFDMEGASPQKAKWLAAIACIALEKEGMVDLDDAALAISFGDNPDEATVLHFGSTINRPPTVQNFTFGSKRFNLGFKQLASGVYSIITEVKGGDVPSIKNAQQLMKRLDEKEQDSSFFE